MEEHAADPDHQCTQRVQHLPRGGTHVLRDGYAGEVEEGDGEDCEGENAVQPRLMIHLAERICTDK